MNKLTILLFGLIILTTFVVGVLWEFWLEPRLPTSLVGSPVETPTDKWEYVLTATGFVLLALIVPFWLTVRSNRERAATIKGLLQAAKVFDNTADGVMITDANGQITAVNRAFTEITGFHFRDVLGKNPRILRSDRHNVEYYQALWSALQKAGTWQGEVWNRRKSGEVYPIWENISAIRNDQGQVTNYVAIFSDISVMKRSEERLAHLASHDPLTDLPNRLLCEDRLKLAMRRAHRTGHRVAVLFLDLDGFKAVNDTLGHPMGDKLLQQVSERLSACVRDVDTVARLGGDEFVVILENVTEASDVEHIAGKILSVLGEAIHLDGNEASVTASIGISLFPDDADSGSVLVRNADAAMYQAKDKGRNTYQFYSTDTTPIASGEPKAGERRSR